MVLVPRLGTVRAGAETGEDRGGALNLAGDQIGEHHGGVQAQVQGERVTAEARHQIAHPGRYGVPALCGAALLQPGVDGAQLPDDGCQETNVLGTDPVELGDEVTERVGLGQPARGGW